MVHFELSADMPPAEAGRVIMAKELAKILEHEAVIRTGATVTAVHEMRKAIRRTFTSYILFSHYYKKRIIKRYRRGLRRMMRRLGRSRDVAVFRMKLDAYNQGIDQPLEDLAAYWQAEQTTADGVVTAYLNKKKPQKIFSDYQLFTGTPGSGIKAIDDPWEPAHIGQLIPVMIFERVATIQSFADHISDATLKEMHELRIQFKELRYTIGFFKSLLGPEIQPALIHLNDIQDHLGDLNDATVALEMLDEVPGLEASIAEYRVFQDQEIERLVTTFVPVWQEFNQPQWRSNLSMAITTL